MPEWKSNVAHMSFYENNFSTWFQGQSGYKKIHVDTYNAFCYFRSIYQHVVDREAFPNIILIACFLWKLMMITNENHH